jgi:TonB family protein
MNWRIVTLVVILFGAAASAVASDKGMCPPSPPRSAFPTPKKAATPPSRLDVTFVGTVTVLAVVSDTGYVCSAQVGNGVKDKKINADAVKTVSQFRFDPARKDGRAVPTFTRVEVHYWRDGNGNLVHELLGAPKPQPHDDNRP